MLVPLKNIDIKARLEDGVAIVAAQMLYVNESEGDETKSLECSFEFPLEESCIVSKLFATVDDRTIEAKIQGKEEAKEKYDDAVAAGNTAVFAERKKQDESLTLLLGNLPAGQTAEIEIQMIMPLKIEASSYNFTLPVSFLPNLKSHKEFRHIEGQIQEVNLDLDYTFSY